MRCNLGPRCRYCGTDLVLNQTWSPSKRQRGERICKRCHTASVRRWKQANPERTRRYNRKYYTTRIQPGLRRWIWRLFNQPRGQER